MSSGNHGRSFRIHDENSPEVPYSVEITMTSYPACNETSLSRKPHTHTHIYIYIYIYILIKMQVSKMTKVISQTLNNKNLEIKEKKKKINESSDDF